MLYFIFLFSLTIFCESHTASGCFERPSKYEKRDLCTLTEEDKALDFYGFGPRFCEGKVDLGDFCFKLDSNFSVEMDDETEDEVDLYDEKM